MPIPASTRTTEPAFIAAEILKEIESFEEEAAKVLNAEVSSDVFRPFRLQHGGHVRDGLRLARERPRQAVQDEVEGGGRVWPR